MKTTDFYVLDADMQTRLLWALRGRFGMRPLLFQPAGRGSLVGVLVAGLALASFAALAGYDFGVLGSPWARQPRLVAILYGSLLALAASGILHAVRGLAEERALPFDTGIYLFGASLIDARSRFLEVMPLEELTDVEIGAGALTLLFGEQRFTFSLAVDDVERSAQAVRRAAEQARDLDPALRAQLDPLAPAVVPTPLSVDDVIVGPPPRWPRFVPVALVLAAAAGLALFVLRDRASDDRAFAGARARGDVESLEAYVRMGERHRDEAATVLLPRAALQVARGEGTVAAIDAVDAAHPNHVIGVEIADARRSAVEGELDAAIAEGSLRALVAFEERRPDHHLEGRVDRAFAALHDKHRERALAQVAARAELRAAVGRLLDRAAVVRPDRQGDELRGLGLAVRVQSLPSRAMDRADRLVKRNPYFAGPRSLPTRYLDPAHLAPRQAVHAKSLAGSLAKVFDPAMLRVHPGEPLAADMDRVDAPTLVVKHRLEPSGQNYASRRPRGIFVGIVLFATVELWLPGDDEPALRERFVFAEPIPVDVVTDVSTGDEREARAYAAMVERAYAALEGRLLARWLSRPT